MKTKKIVFKSRWGKKRDVTTQRGYAIYNGKDIPG